jgi:hypothetical protein
VGPARQAKGCFFRQKTSLLLFARHLSLVTRLAIALLGDRKPAGCRRGGKAEARRAASAQAAFPSRRAREKTVSEKVNRMRRTQAGRHEKAAYFKLKSLLRCTL